MISASLHPEPVRAACQPRGRFAFGLTPRTIWLLAAGLLLALPGFFSARLRLRHAGVGCTGAARRASATACGCRLPHEITIERSWSNAPSLDSETEIEIAVEQSGETILECRLVDDLAGGAGGHARDAQSCAPFRACARRCATKSSRASAAMCAPERSTFAIASPLGLVERWAMAPLEQTGARVSGAAAGRGPGDLSCARPPDRSAAAPGARARTGPRFREPARVSRRRRSARRVLDGDCAARPVDHAPLPDRAQPGGVDRSRRGKAAARQNPATDDGRSRSAAATPSSTTPARPRWLWRNWRCFPAIAWACSSTGSMCSSACCPAAAPRICGRLSKRSRRRAPKRARPITCAPRPR